MQSKLLFYLLADKVATQRSAGKLHCLAVSLPVDGLGTPKYPTRTEPVYKFKNTKVTTDQYLDPGPLSGRNFSSYLYDVFINSRELYVFVPTF